jgi:hypothetical protein
MTTATLSAAQLTRINLDTTPGFPKLPHVPENWGIELTPQQQEENLLHVALWIVERDLENFRMKDWHKSWAKVDFNIINIRSEQAHAKCGTTHCIAGFSQVMAGRKGFTESPWEVGTFLLGQEARYHFWDSDEVGLDFLKEVIARNS